MAGAPRPLRFLVARWPLPPRVFDLRRVRRPLPPHSAVSAGRGGCFSLWGGRRSAGRPPPQRLLLFVLFLAAAAAVLTLSAVKDKDVLTHDYHKVKDKTAVVRVLGGVHVVSVRVSVAAVLSVLVRRGVLVLPWRRRGLFALLLLLLPLLGGHGLLLSAVGVAVGADLREGGRLPLGDLPVLLVYRRLFPLLVVARSPLSPPPRRTTPCCRRWSGWRVPPRCSRASGRARGR